MPGVLSGTTVIDLSWGLSGAVLGMLLADNGARVIRVESPRQAGRPRFTGEQVWDRGKQSVALDISVAAGQRALRRLLHGADVLVESFPPGTMEGWGLGYADLHAELPGLVYCSITG